MVFMFVMSVSVVGLWFTGVEETTDTNESCISNRHQQDGNTCNSVGKIRKVCIDFFVMHVVEMFRLSLGDVALGCKNFLFMVVVVFQLLPSIVLSVCQSDSECSKQQYTDGEDDSSHHDCAHPNSVFNVRTVSAHSSAPFGVAFHIFSPIEGFEEWWPYNSFMSPWVGI